MPTYEYRCRDCNHQFEVFQSIKDDPVDICPTCGGQVTKILSGGIGLIFRGSGFYITDYKNKKAPDSNKDSAPKKESKQDAKESGSGSDKKAKDTSSD